MNVHWVPNGVQLKHYQKLISIPSLENFFKQIQRPVIGYIGTIQNRLDLDLIVSVAKTHPEWSIVMAGPIWKDQNISHLKKYKNIFFLGRIPFENTPYVIDQFDIGIIPHRINDFVKSMDPMKMYDYLARGKPVVVTSSVEIGFFSDLIYVGENTQDFIEEISKALQEDSQNLKNVRFERIKNHTYTNRVETMLELIQSYVPIGIDSHESICENTDRTYS